MLAEQPDLGDLRTELGEDVRASSFGSYVIYFRARTPNAQIIRILRGDRDQRVL